ncbi:MAG: DUF4013 domain-containing protein, partial [Actinomycetota bacterium]|nr:DUF4013 domain-containing protein [Actinomycetota bacterium]
MDIGRAFGVPFKDEKWLAKTALGALWGLLGVTAPALTGYQLDYTRAVAEGRELPLLDWSDFGRLWVRGFLGSLAMFIYMIPAVIIGTIGLLPLIASAASGDEMLAGAAMGTVCLTSFLAVAYVIAVSVFAYAALTNYAMRENFGSLFAFGEIWQRVKTPNSGYFMAWIMSMFFAFGASAVGSVLSATGIGAILVGWPLFISQIMTAHLLGQYAAVAYQRPGLAGVSSSGPSAGTYTQTT